MQRLEELMQWQRQQQGKLLRHQEEQKALISKEQKRLLQDIGLVLKEPLATIENDKPQERGKCVAASNDEVANEEMYPQTNRAHSFDEISVQPVQVFDEIPVQQVNKTFNELLQEKLAGDEQSKNVNPRGKAKKAFLKKGEGLARFRMSYNKRNLGPSRKCEAHSKGCKENDSLVKANPKKSTIVSNVSDSITRVGNSASQKYQVVESNPETKATWSQTLQKTSQPHTRVCEVPKNFEVSKNEQDELQVFELLEQHAANSSFCSTSSVVTKFLSEPEKLICHRAPSPKVPAQNHSLKRQQSPGRFKIQHNKADNPNKLLEMNRYADMHFKTICAKSVQTGEVKNEKCSKFSSQIKPAVQIPRKLQFDACNSDHDKKENKMLRSKDCEVQYKSNSSRSGIGMLNRETAYNTIIRNEDNDNVHRPHSDVFEDSQAWSDCSYSSSDETLSGNEHVSCEKETLAKDKVPLKTTTETNIPEPLTPHRDAITFKSTLLKERLMELENEIEIFKKENANLRKLKKQYEEDIVNFNKEKKEYEKLLKENTEKMQESIIAERKKLAREKQVFEKYCKDIKNQPNKEEREEIKALKLQIADLQDELIKKDQRWSASQVRMRDRMRLLNKQISELKEENEKLKAEKAKIKKVRFLNPKLNVASNTKVLHSVNDKLAKLRKEDFETPIVIKNVVPRKRIPAKVLNQNVAGNKEIKMVESNLKSQTSWDSRSNIVYEKSDSSHSEDDCREELYCEQEYHTEDKTAFNGSGEPLSKDLIYSAFFPMGESKSAQILRLDLEENAKKSEVQTNKTMKTGEKEVQSGPQEKTSDIISEENVVNIDKRKGTYPCLTLNSNSVDTVSLSKEVGFVNDSGNNFQDTLQGKLKNSETTETLLPDGTREKKFPDGRREIWYPNGNVKKISADNLISKMIYFNGDVKEKYHLDGTEKYYYAETKAWQTTYSDGREILEFPNGQIESKMPNGQSQITYPNGCSLIKHVDGSEEWALANGTIVKRSASGDQELLFPNGQKEIHTAEHKRREYPDGTVKYVYPDGMQETRYASGRVRRKDKDGNLIMDSTVR